MALTVQITVTRPDTETSWPWEGVSELTQLNTIREEHGATSTDSISDDGLTWTWTESCPLETGDAYFDAYQAFWQNEGVQSNADSTNVTVISTVLDSSE